MTKLLFVADELHKLAQYNKLIVGFSGGLDSTVLLHALVSQGFKNIKAIHINHGLSSNALEWQKHCQDFCQNLNLPIILKKVQFNRSSNIEEGARKARFKVFSTFIEENDALVLGHHQNDQAETVLLNLFRGTGIDGLAAMVETKTFAKGHLLRPLLNRSRSELEAYARTFHLNWVEDESNKDKTYARNFLREEVIPLITSRWPALIKTLNRTSKHALAAKENLEELALQDCPELISNKEILDTESIQFLTHQRKLNVIRLWFKLNKQKLPNSQNLNRIIFEMIDATWDSQPEIQFKTYSVRRFQKKLYFVIPRQFDFNHLYYWSDITRSIEIKGLGVLSLEKASQGLKIPNLSKIEIRFRQNGERIRYKGQTKALKKIFQALSIPPWLRQQIPLLYINNELAAIVGYVISDSFFTNSESCYQFKLELSKL